MSSSSSNRRPTSSINHRDVQICDCGFRVQPRTSWTRKNPGRRFISCPIIDDKKKCRLYRFLDVELPSEYYKELFFELHQDLEGLKLSNNSELYEEIEVSRMEVLKAKEELKIGKAKLQVFERVFMLMLGVVVVLCFVIGVLTR